MPFACLFRKKKLSLRCETLTGFAIIRLSGCRNGGMVDTGHLKSLGLYRLCGFESHFLYPLQRGAVAIDAAPFSFSYISW